MMDKIQRYNKLIAAVVVPAIVWGAESAGLPVPEAFAAELTAVLTALVVWIVPNKS